jgi:hypothetical protein
MSSALAEKEVAMKKYSEWKKCTLCLYPNNFEVEIKQDKDGNYFYSDKCPKCGHYDEFRAISRREASKYLVIDEIQ